MNKNQIAILFSCAFTVFGSSLLFADAITKPHTFSAGAAANASDVNENFDTVYNQTNKIGSQINIDTVNGRVGIGTQTPGARLDVGGGVRIGTDTAACTPGYSGTLRFNSGLLEMEYCDGNSWKSLQPKTPVIWAGGCASHGTLSGQWQDYCTNMIDYNYASSHINVNANGSITFLISGFYNVNFYTVARGSSVILARFTKNGSIVMMTESDGAVGWFPIRMEKIIQFNAGDVLLVSSYAVGGAVYTYHAHDASNLSGLQVSYEGPLN